VIDAPDSAKERAEENLGTKSLEKETFELAEIRRVPISCNKPGLPYPLRPNEASLFELLNLPLDRRDWDFSPITQGAQAQWAIRPGDEQMREQLGLGGRPEDRELSH
jgi:hypothetical protein